MIGDKEFWDKFSGKIEQKHFTQVMEWINLLDPKKVLDAGCGLSHYMKAFSDYMVEVHGFDLSEEAINRCPYPELKDKIVKGDLTDIPYEENFADLLICYDILEHIPEYQVDKAISEMKRVSSKYILLSITTIDNSNFPLDPTHVTGRLRQWWEDKLIKAGLKLMKVPLNIPYYPQIIIAEVIK